MKTDETLTITTRDGASVAVRGLRRSDHKALQEFNASLSAESRRKFLPHAYDDDTVRKALDRAESGDDFILGAFDGRRLIGYFFLWRAKERIPLLGIGMLDEWQHRGLGAQMMEILIREARETNRDGVELTTMMDNHAAFALYRKAGFSYYGDVENRVGDGSIVIERGMFYPIKPGARPMGGLHAPPV